MILNCSLYLYCINRLKRHNINPMKKSIFAFMIAAAALTASCGNKTTEEVVETPVEEVAPETEEVETMEETPADSSGTSAETTSN
jgi:hypothetical protein